jgi:hypothetical protein
MISRCGLRTALLAKLPKRLPVELGKGLMGDLLFINEIFEWQTSAKGDQSSLMVELAACWVKGFCCQRLCWPHPPNR